MTSDTLGAVGKMVGIPTFCVDPICPDGEIDRKVNLVESATVPVFSQ